MAMAIKVAGIDYVPGVKCLMTELTVLEENARNCDVHRAAEWTKYKSAKRNLALTSPSPSLGVRRACIPVALELPSALTSGPLRRRLRACIPRKSPCKGEATVTMKKKPPFPADELGGIRQATVATIRSIIIFVEGIRRLQDARNEDMNATVKGYLTLSTPCQLLMGWYAWIPAGTRTWEPSALTSGEPRRLLRA